MFKIFGATVMVIVLSCCLEFNLVDCSPLPSINDSTITKTATTLSTIQNYNETRFFEDAITTTPSSLSSISLSSSSSSSPAPQSSNTFTTKTFKDDISEDIYKNKFKNEKLNEEGTKLLYEEEKKPLLLSQFSTISSLRNLDTVAAVDDDDDNNKKNLQILPETTTKYINATSEATTSLGETKKIATTTTPFSAQSQPSQTPQQKQPSLPPQSTSPSSSSSSSAVFVPFESKDIIRVVHKIVEDVAAAAAASVEDNNNNNNSNNNNNNKNNNNNNNGTNKTESNERNDRTVVVVVTTNIYTSNSKNDHLNKEQHNELSFGKPEFLNFENKQQSNSFMDMHNKITTAFFNRNESVNNNFDTSSKTIDDNHQVPFNAIIKSSDQKQNNGAVDIKSQIPTTTTAVSTDKQVDPKEIINNIQRLKESLDMPPRKVQIFNEKNIIDSVLKPVDRILDPETRAEFIRDIPTTRHIPMDIVPDQTLNFQPLLNNKETIFRSDFINEENIHHEFVTVPSMVSTSSNQKNQQTTYSESTQTPSFS